MKIAIAITLLIAATAILPTIEAISCRGGHIACMGSCQIQNCATGRCTSIPHGICVCSRCGVGKPSYP